MNCSDGWQKVFAMGTFSFCLHMYSCTLGNMQLLQLRKESLEKISGLYGIQTFDLCDTGARSALPILG